mmetsp:Transcript_15543/g.40207  ORF Transcript_15543/g.40207 Transcript_15543/m.40207 type:complete len:266 (+) Transcript_15543:564-1361(+)
MPALEPVVAVNGEDVRAGLQAACLALAQRLQASKERSLRVICHLQRTGLGSQGVRVKLQEEEACCRVLLARLGAILLQGEAERRVGRVALEHEELELGAGIGVCKHVEPLVDQLLRHLQLVEARLLLVHLALHRLPKLEPRDREATRIRGVQHSLRHGSFDRHTQLGEHRRHNCVHGAHARQVQLHLQFRSLQVVEAARIVAPPLVRIDQYVVRRNDFLELIRRRLRTRPLVLVRVVAQRRPPVCTLDLLLRCAALQAQQHVRVL